MAKARVKRKGSGFAGSVLQSLLRIVFVINALLALLQVITSLRQWQPYLELGFSSVLLIYLLVSSLVKLVLHSLAFFHLQKGQSRGLWSAWLAIIFALVSYWAEYFFLWHPDQRADPPWFTLVVHLLLVAILIVYRLSLLRKEASDGSGN